MGTSAAIPLALDGGSRHSERGDNMELIHAFILSVVGFVLIYRYGERCVSEQKKAIDFGVIMAAFDFMIAGISVAKWFGER